MAARNNANRFVKIERMYNSFFLSIYVRALHIQTAKYFISSGATKLQIADAVPHVLLYSLKAGKA